MAPQTGKPMSVGTIFVIIILASGVVGALLGIFGAELGGPAWLTGAVAGMVVGGLAQLLYRRRNPAPMIR
jgi:hypothetical protein